MRCLDYILSVVIYIGCISACPTIVSRAEWKALPPKQRQPMVTPVPFVIIHHTDMDECFNFEQCAAEMRKIQRLHMEDRGWDDIGYNFLIGEDGKAYEGRGWDTVGAQAPWYNSRSQGVSIMGNYMKKLPNELALNATHSLIKCFLNKDKLQGNFTMYGHRQVRVAGTTCPGDMLYKEIQSWPHWEPGQHYPPNSSSLHQPVQEV